MTVYTIDVVEECPTCGAVFYNGKEVSAGDRPCSHRMLKKD